jgi:hypothetical protein
MRVGGARAAGGEEPHRESGPGVSGSAVLRRRLRESAVLLRLLRQSSPQLLSPVPSPSDCDCDLRLACVSMKLMRPSLRAHAILKARQQLPLLTPPNIHAPMSCEPERAGRG